MNTDKPVVSPESLIVRFIRSVYAPLLLRQRVKYAVLAIFSGLFVASWVCTDYIQLGLGQSSFNSYCLHHTDNESQTNDWLFLLIRI